MRRPLLPSIAALLAASAVLSAGCSDDPSGAFSFRVDGDVPEAMQDVAIDWDDGGVTWTREVRCAVTGEVRDSTYEVVATDRSVGAGVEVRLVVQAFDGPGNYDRDEFQPRPALEIEYAADDGDGADDDDSAGAGEDGEDEDGAASGWQLGSDSGGECTISVAEDVTSGGVVCTGIPVVEGRRVREDVADVVGAWSCSELAPRTLAAPHGMSR